MDFKIVFILFVVLKDQVQILIVVRHMGKHLKDLLKSCLGSGVLTDRELLFFVLQ